MGTILVIKKADFFANRVYSEEEVPMRTEIETTTTGYYLSNNLSNIALDSYDIVSIPIPEGCTKVILNYYCGKVAYGHFPDTSTKFAGTSSNVLSTTINVPSGAEYLRISYEARRSSQTIEQYVIFSDNIDSYKLVLPTS